MALQLSNSVRNDGMSTTHLTGRERTHRLALVRPVVYVGEYPIHKEGESNDPMAEATFPPATGLLSCLCLRESLVRNVRRSRILEALLRIDFANRGIHGSRIDVGRCESRVDTNIKCTVGARARHAAYVIHASLLPNCALRMLTAEII